MHPHSATSPLLDQSERPPLPRRESDHQLASPLLDMANHVRCDPASRHLRSAHPQRPLEFWNPVGISLPHCNRQAIHHCLSPQPLALQRAL